MRFLLFFFAGACCAQHLGVGVKGGIPVTTDIEGSGTSESRRYLVGPMIEVRLPFGFGVEADALYRRFGYSTTFEFLSLASSVTRARANSWEFPIVAKYRWRLPCILAGVAPRHVDGEFANSGTNTNPTTGVRSFSSSTGKLDFVTGVGFVAGGGVEFGLGRIHVAPEVRYIRWKDPMFSDFGSRGYYLLVPQNEVQVLMGLTWR